jgi:hypothetical protein
MVDKRYNICCKVDAALLACQFGKRGWQAGDQADTLWKSVMSASDKLTETLMTSMSAGRALMSQVVVDRCFAT